MKSKFFKNEICKFSEICFFDAEFHQVISGYHWGIVTTKWQISLSPLGKKCPRNSILNKKFQLTSYYLNLVERVLLLYKMVAKMNIA